MREYRTVKVSDINVGERFIDPLDVELPELVADIKKVGLQVPVLVDDQLNLFDGLRRLQAFKPDDTIDVVVSSDYVTTMEIMLADKDRPLTRAWTTRRLWDFHRDTTSQRKSHHARSAVGSLPRTKAAYRPVPQTIYAALGMPKKVSLSRDLVAKISNIHQAEVQAALFLYARAYGMSEAEPGLQPLAVDLVKDLDQGGNVYTARHTYEKARRERKPNIVTEKEQRQVLRSASATAVSASRIIADVSEINKGISVEEAQMWLKGFSQARAEYYDIIKKLKERIKRG